MQPSRKGILANARGNCKVPHSPMFLPRSLPPCLSVHALPCLLNPCPCQLSTLPQCLLLLPTLHPCLSHSSFIHLCTPLLCLTPSTLLGRPHITLLQHTWNLPPPFLLSLPLYLLVTLTDLLLLTHGTGPAHLPLAHLHLDDSLCTTSASLWLLQLFCFNRLDKLYFIFAIWAAYELCALKTHWQPRCLAGSW